MKKILLLLLIVTVACKNEPKAVSNEAIAETEIEPTKELVVNVNFKTNKAGDFKLMLNNVKVDEFQTKNIHVIEKVVPTSGIETITATFGANNISRVFYFNLGSKEPKEVEIESMSLTYGSKSINVSASELGEYFAYNKFVTLDSVSNTFKTKRVDGKHSPNLIFKGKYMEVLLKQ